MSYLTREHMIETCQKMQNFYLQLSKLYSNNGMDLESNRGRRNILMSAPMEHFLAESLRESFLVENDGRTGKADIIVHLGTGNPVELECKLTSPHSSGTIAFQTDYETLQRKGSLDFIYLIANENFDQFCAVYFRDLTTDDFRGLSNGSRGKVQMFKHSGMKKATVLLGNVIDLREQRLEQILEYKESLIIRSSNQVAKWKLKKSALKKTQIYDQNQFDGKIERSREKLSKRLNNIIERINIVKDQNSRYTFKYESLERQSEIS